MRNEKEEILEFWFHESTPTQWFQVNPEYDETIRKNFLKAWDKAKAGFYKDYEDDPDGALALIILLDQFPRNMFRDDPRCYETDAQALEVAEEAIKNGFDQMHPVLRRRFFYLPYEHSENMEHQNRAVELFEEIKEDDPIGYEYAIRHRKVIEKFGRFPHRNALLGRASTTDEIEFLKLTPQGF
ncbi:MAG: DUF924 family protein [Alphaproteobacteria bacterium]|nr:DUF924 family protein [Alphaproteobacteria bacterium]